MSSLAEYDLYEDGIVKLQHGLESGHFTSVDLVQAYLARIDEVNLKGPALRAIIETNPSALDQAKALDEEREKSGPCSRLHGIPVLLKDNIATGFAEGMQTTAGSFALFGSVVPRDAAVAAKLRTAGAIFIGKANMSEWAHFRGNLESGWSGRGGQATSPYYPKGNPTGSSSGSGTGIAIGLATVALGTETDGSIMSPSSRNNVVGMKPTVGLTSRAGVVPISYHQDSVGPMTRSVSDAAILLSIVSGPDPLDPLTTHAPQTPIDYAAGLNLPSASEYFKGKRFGVPRAFMSRIPKINEVFEEQLKVIEKLGGVVVDNVEVRHSEAMIERSSEMLVMKTEFKAHLAKYISELKHVPTGVRNLEDVITYTNEHPETEKPEGYADITKLTESQATRGLDDEEYVTARANNVRYGGPEGVDLILKEHSLDALVLPGESNASMLAAIDGHPIINIPMGFLFNDILPETDGPHTFHPTPGMPFGMQFIGAKFTERDLLRFAFVVEQETNVRPQRKAYDAAIPKTQLGDVVGARGRAHDQVIRK